MRLTIFACDSATVADEKLYVLGAGIWSLTAAEFPMILPTLGVGMIAYLSPDEIDVPHSFELSLRDFTGQPCSWQIATTASATDTDENPLSGSFTLARDPAIPPGLDRILLGAFNFRHIVLKEAGRYSIGLTIGGLAHEEIPLYVVAAQ